LPNSGNFRQCSDNFRHRFRQCSDDFRQFQTPVQTMFRRFQTTLTQFHTTSYDFQTRFRHRFLFSLIDFGNNASPDSLYSRSCGRSSATADDSMPPAAAANFVFGTRGHFLCFYVGANMKLIVSQLHGDVRFVKVAELRGWNHFHCPRCGRQLNPWWAANMLSLLVCVTLFFRQLASNRWRFRWCTACMAAMQE
jgi:hypothetical protein